MMCGGAGAAAAAAETYKLYNVRLYIEKNKKRIKIYCKKRV